MSAQHGVDVYNMGQFVDLFPYGLEVTDNQGNSGTCKNYDAMVDDSMN